VKEKLPLILIVLILILVGTGVFFNIREQQAVDDSKIPEKVELNRGFQRWITNLKNKGMEVNADEFTLKEKNEIYNTKWIKVYSVEDTVRKAEYENILKSSVDVKKIIFSPSEREIIDYRNILRDGYQTNEVRFYGQKEDKIIDARIVDCSVRANCYFDRAYFLDNDVFVISEFSRNIKKGDEQISVCSLTDTCTYTIKIHVVDLIKNSRYVYESKPFESSMSWLVPNL
jgi:hypothetical protein